MRGLLRRWCNVFKEVRRSGVLSLKVLRKLAQKHRISPKTVMLDIANVQAVFLDHSYCKPAPLDIGFSPILQKDLLNMADNMLDWKDEIGIQFDPPSVGSDATFSALSPSRSVDSGFDSEMNFLSELDGLDLDMILNGDINANVSKTKQIPLKPNASKRPSTSATSTKTNTKAIEEMSEMEKSRKNAVAARENRLKKKKYVEGIEQELEELRRENEILKSKDQRHNQVVEKLEQEVSYLKSVLANQSTLSVLMNRLATTPGISFNLATDGSSLPNPTPNPVKQDDDGKSDVVTDDASDDDDNHEPNMQSGTGNVRRSVRTRCQTRGTKRSATTETEQVVTGRKRARPGVKGGVCLHIGQDMVSVTFCSQCSRNVNGNTGK